MRKKPTTKYLLGGMAFRELAFMMTAILSLLR